MTTTLQLTPQDLTPWLPNPTANSTPTKCDVNLVYQTLKQVLQKHLQHPHTKPSQPQTQIQPQLAFPPLQALSEVFRCSQMMVYDALQLLSAEGYDYALDGFENPIPVWKKTQNAGLLLRFPPLEGGGARQSERL